MKLRDALAGLDNVEIDKAVISGIEALYKTKFSNEVQKVISLNKDGVSYDDKSVFNGLSAKAILNAYNDLYIDFVSLQLVPLFDIGDSEYIVFNLKKRCYALYDISEDNVYSEESDLLNYV
jgi:lambda repressor-like predicted transcriptional regulator